MKHYFLSLVLSAAILLNAQNTYACAFESAEHADLLQSVRNLDAQLRSIPGECLPGGGKDAFKSVQDLQASSTTLQQLNGHSTLAPLDASNFGMSAQTAMESISTIGKSIKQAATCSKLEKKDGLVTVLSTLSDVSMSLAPVLMAATVFLPALTAGGAFGVVAGAALKALPVGKLLSTALLVGVFSTVAEVSVDLFENDTNKMADPNYRSLVLKSICEYRRIKTNVDYLSYINTGRANVKKEKAELEARVIALRKRFEKEDPKMVKLIDQFYAVRKQTEDESRKITATRGVLAKIDTDFGASDDNHYRCNVVAQRVKSGTSILTHLALPSVPNVADQFSSPSYSVQALVSTIKNNESIIIQAYKDQQGEVCLKNIEACNKTADICAKNADLWRRNLSSLLSQLTRFNREKTEQQMGALFTNPQFIAWRQQNKSLEADALLLERIIGFMSASPDPRQIIPETDLIIEVQELGKRIFTRKGYNFVTGKSMAGAWLDHRLNAYEKTVDEFNRVFVQLNSKINNKALQLYFAKAKVAQQKAIQKTSGSAQVNQYEVQKITSKFNLESLTLQTLKELNDPQIAVDVCRDLNAMYIQSNNAGKLLNSAKYFCNYLEENELKNTEMDAFIVSKCWGRINLGNDKSTSYIENLTKSTGGITGLRTRMAIVQKNMDMLNCAQPNRPR